MVVEYVVGMTNRKVFVSNAVECALTRRGSVYNTFKKFGQAQKFGRFRGIKLSEIKTYFT